MEVSLPVAVALVCTVVAMTASLTGDGSAACSEPSLSIMQIAVPTGTSSPVPTNIFVSLPATVDGISALTLSVLISQIGSYSSTQSPGCFSQRSIVADTCDSASCGNVISVITLIYRSTPNVSD